MKSIADNELMQMDVKVLQTMLDEAGYSGVEIDAMKQRRRRLQNRQSAKLSAARRQGEFDSIVQLNARLTKTVVELEARNAELVQQLAKANQMALQIRAVADQAIRENEALRMRLATQHPTTSADSADDPSPDRQLVPTTPDYDKPKAFPL